MISLNEYKEYLVDKYNYEIDNNEEKREYRNRLLSTMFEDAFLEKIISDTYEFVGDILNSTAINDGYYIIQVNDDETSYISLNLIGGYPSDTLYKDNNGRIISRYIISDVFNNEFSMYVNQDDVTFEEDDIVSTYCNYALVVHIFSKDINKIKNELLGKTKQIGGTNGKYYTNL